MFASLSAGIVYGLSAGFSPGPLTALVISQTLRYGIKEGAKVAAAPVITDLPIILVSFWVLTRLANFKPILGGISLIGGLFVVYLAYGSFRSRSPEVSSEKTVPQSLVKGVVANALNPHPYLFWLTVGGPAMVRGWAVGPWGPPVFLLAFFICIVGSKVLIAWVAGRSRQWLRGPAYRAVEYVLGTLLLVFAFFLFREGWRLLMA